MITNSKINQPFMSNFSREEGEKNSTLANMEPAELSTMLKRFYVEAREVSGRKTIQSRHYESQFVPGWTDFYLGPFKESCFPLFGKKYSSRQTARL